MQQADRGLKELLFGEGCAPGGPAKASRFAAKLNTLLPMISAIVDRAKATGQLRADVDPTDLAVIQFMLHGVGTLTAPVEPQLWRRQLAILLDGLRADRKEVTPLPVMPLSFDQLQTVCMPPTTQVHAHHHRH
jgi:hypothetical protein